MPSNIVYTNLPSKERTFFDREGYLIRRGLFSTREAEGLQKHFMGLHERREIPNYEFQSLEEADGDILKVYPRVMFPHRWDETAKNAMLAPRIRDTVQALIGEEAVATQSMLYFKPPGARGQAFHQDNFYLQVRPKTCIAAWVALDRVEPENGGLFICPGTHEYELQCPDDADLGESFTVHLVRPPEGTKPVPARMEAGDVLFFNGCVVHGSGPNRSKDRWRRSFICHYAPRSMEEIARWYHPLLDFEGNEVPYPVADGGGPCGVEPESVH